MARPRRLRSVRPGHSPAGRSPAQRGSAAPGAGGADTGGGRGRLEGVFRSCLNLP